MHSSPISSWEGAAAYFTFADSPMAIAFFFILAVVITIGTIGVMMKHEKESFEKYKD